MSRNNSKQSPMRLLPVPRRVKDLLELHPKFIQCPQLPAACRIIPPGSVSPPVLDPAGCGEIATSGSGKSSALPFVNFALYAWVSFFRWIIDGFVELLGHMEAVHHGLGIWQQLAAGVMERLGHVRPIRSHPLTLLERHFFQALVSTASGREGPASTKKGLVKRRMGTQRRFPTDLPLIRVRQHYRASCGKHGLRFDSLRVLVALTPV